MSYHPNRRRVIKGTGAALTGVSIAGCSGDGGDGGGDGGDGGGDGGDGGDGSDGGGSDGGGDGGVDYPSEDIRLIIPYGTGGGYDFYGRLIAKYLENYLDTSVNPENVTGGGGQVGNLECFTAEPDGHTFQVISLSGSAREQAVGEYEDNPLDLREYTWLGQIVSAPNLLTVGPHTDVENFQDFVEAVNNEELIFANSGGLTAIGSLVPAVIGRLTGLYPPENVFNNSVNYEGRSEIISAIQSEEVDVTLTSVSSLLPFVEADEVRPILFITTDEEPPIEGTETLVTATPEIEDETANQISSVSAETRAMAAPPDVPQERFEILSGAIEDVFNDDDFRQEAEEAERPLDYAGPEEAENQAVTAVETWSNELRDLLTDPDS